MAASLCTCIWQHQNILCGIVAETIAYDTILEAEIKVQIQQRKLLLHGPWKWLVTEFSSYYGVSDAYTKLRYLSYVMDVAIPTANCLNVVHDLLSAKEHETLEKKFQEEFLEFFVDVDP